MTNYRDKSSVREGRVVTWKTFLVGAVLAMTLGVLVITGGGNALLGNALTATGTWLAVVAAVILGTRIANADLREQVTAIKNLVSPTRAVVGFLREHPGAVIEDIIESTGLRRADVTTALLELEGAGRLTPTDGGFRLTVPPRS